MYRYTQSLGTTHTLLQMGGRDEGYPLPAENNEIDTVSKQTV